MVADMGMFDSIFLQRLQQRVRERLGVYFRKSYSQCGEDLIVSYIFNTLKVARPSYLDIGAHHPYYLSNTYLFYRLGGRGVCIEPDPFLFRRFLRGRKRDTNLNVGMAGERGSLNLHVFTSRTLNTFSEEEAARFVAAGHQQVSTHTIDVMTFAEIVRRCFDKAPDFVSLDTEGMDLQILRSIDFAEIHPTVFCIETITYSRTGEGKKLTDIDDIMIENGYMKYADTHINSIYVDRERWLAQQHTA